MGCQNTERKGEQGKEKLDEKLGKRKKLVKSPIPTHGSSPPPQLSDIPMKAHKLTVALWSQRPKKNDLQFRRLSTDERLQQMFWRLLAFESWLKVVSASERGEGGKKNGKKFKIWVQSFMFFKTLSEGRNSVQKCFSFSAKVLLCIF